MCSIPNVVAVVHNVLGIVPWGCLQFVIVIFPDHTHLLFCVQSFFYGKVYCVLSDVSKIDENCCKQTLVSLPCFGVTDGLSLQLY